MKRYLEFLCLFALFTGLLQARNDLVDFGIKLIERGEYRKASDIFKLQLYKYARTDEDKRLAKLALGYVNLELEKEIGRKYLEELLDRPDKYALNALYLLYKYTDDTLEKANRAFELAIYFPDLSLSKRELKGFYNFGIDSAFLNITRKSLLFKALKLYEKSKSFSQYRRVLRVIISDYGENALRKSLARSYIVEDSLEKALRVAGDSIYFIRALVFLRKGDTLRALYNLRKDTSVESRLLKAKLHFKYRDYETAYKLLKGLKQPEAISLKARYFFTTGVYDSLKNYVPRLKDTMLLAEIYLTSGELKGIPFSFFKTPYLRARFYLKTGDILSTYREIEGNEASFPDTFIFRIAKELEKEGLLKQALKLLKGLVSLKKEINIPRESVYRELLYIAEKLGDTSVIKISVNSLSRIGIKVYPSIYPEDSALKIVYRIAKGMPLLKGIELLYAIGAYPEIVKLLEGIELGSLKLKEYLVRAYIMLYRQTGKESYAKLAETILERENLPVSLKVELYRDYNPSKVLALKGPLKLKGDTLKDYLIALIKAGKPLSALKLLKKFHIKDRHLWFSAFLNTGKLDSAYAHLSFERPDDIYALAMAFLKKAPDISFNLLEKINLPGFELDRRARIARIKALIKIGEFKKALNEIETYEAIYNSDDSLRFWHARILAGIKPATAFLKLLPYKDKYAMELKGLILRKLGFKDWAFEYSDYVPSIAFEKALETRDVLKLLEMPLPKDSALVYRYLVLLYENDHSEFANKLADTLDKSGILSLDGSLLAKAEAYLYMKRPAKAVSLLSKIRSNSKRAILYYKLGIYYLREGMHERAKEYFYKAIQWGDPETRGKAAFELATLFFGEKRYKEASEYYDMSKDLVADTSLKIEALHNRAVCLKRTREPDEAVKVYGEIIDKFPATKEAKEATISLALMDLENGNLERALRELKGIVGELKESEEAEIQYWLGKIEAGLNKRVKALSHFKRVYLYHSNIPQWPLIAKVESIGLYLSLGLKSKAKRIYTALINRLPATDPMRKQILKEYGKIFSD